MPNITIDLFLDFLSNGLSNANFWQVVIFTLITTHITISAVTIYLHRCQSHHALTLHPLVSHFFRCWLWLTTGMVTKEWVAVHRKHHAKCETVEDPHSPNILGIKKVLFKGAELYRTETKNKETTTRYGNGTPEDWFESNIYGKYSWQGVGILLGIDLMFFGVIGLTVWAIQMLWIPITAAGIVNGIGHYWGYRNYDCKDAATNFLPIGIIIGGEEFHNNHHTFITSAKLSSKWYEFDIGWFYIRLLQMIGLAEVKKLAPVPKFDRTSLVVDSQTLHSVITNRYDVILHYSYSLHQAWAEERRRIGSGPVGKALFKKPVKKLLQQSPQKLGESEMQQLSSLFFYSDVLKTMFKMRVELASIWDRSSLSQEQLLTRLQNWCARAESSNIQALRDFSFRLRSYC